VALRPHHRRRGPPQPGERPAIRQACEHRRPWASHAVMNGMPLMVVARNLGQVEGRTLHRRWPGQADRARWHRGQDAPQGSPPDPRPPEDPSGAPCAGDPPSEPSPAPAETGRKSKWPM